MSDLKDPKASPTTVTDDEIVTSPDGGRRGVLQALSVAVVGAAAKALTGCVVAQPQPTVQTQPTYAVAQPTQVVQGGYSTGLTDSDGGPYADPVGNGRGTARLGNTGLTDNDGGPYADPVGHGRGRWR